MNTADTTMANQTEPRRGPGISVLAFAAGVLATLLATQVLTFPTARADSNMVSHVGTTTVLTADAGAEDLLLVLDGRSEDLCVYRVEARTGLQLVQRMPVSQVFLDAKARSLGQP